MQFGSTITKMRRLQTFTNLIMPLEGPYFSLKETLSVGGICILNLVNTAAASEANAPFLFFTSVPGSLYHQFW